MRILVTGSDGFVGKHTVNALRERGDLVFGADRKSGLDLSRDGVASHLLDWEPDVIVHLASSCSTPGSVRDPMGTFRDTVVTAANVINAAAITHTPVILTSSVKARDGMTPYGASKRMAELWAIEYRAAYGLPVIINRPGTIYGPGQEGSDESGWIAWFLKARQEKLKVTINGDGTQVRDLLHVYDYVRLLLLQTDDVRRYDTGEIHDVGGGPENAVSVRQMADHLGLDWEFGPERYGDAQVYVGRNDVPDWEPTIMWYRSGMF